MGSNQRSWLRTLRDVPCQRTRLVCFPHSGGYAMSYAPWTAAMPDDVQLAAVQYPGRGDRFGEPPAHSVQEMAACVAAEILGLEPSPCALFGHSLGALVAYETAIALRAAGQPSLQLAVSGSHPPRLAGGGSAHLASDDELWAAVRQMGGVDAEVASNGDLVSLLLPALRADIAMSETYQPQAADPPLACPVYCYYGTDDFLLDTALLPAWAEVTTGSCVLSRREGGHFEIFAKGNGIVEDVLAAMRQQLIGTSDTKHPQRPHRSEP